MPFPNQDYSHRDPSLPPGCKDLADAIKRETASVRPAIPYPRISRWVFLPDLVSVKYLAEVSKVSLRTIKADLQEMRAAVSVGRSVDFAVAAQILRKYGIAAKRVPWDP